MARPIKIRNARAYIRDIEHLGRLRTAILLDPQMTPSRVESAHRQIDDLVATLNELSIEAQKKSA